METMKTPVGEDDTLVTVQGTEAEEDREDEKANGQRLTNYTYISYTEAETGVKDEECSGERLSILHLLDFKRRESQ